MSILTVDEQAVESGYMRQPQVGEQEVYLQAINQALSGDYYTREVGTIYRKATMRDIVSKAFTLREIEEAML